MKMMILDADDDADDNNDCGDCGDGDDVYQLFQDAFKEYDKDGSGDMNAVELRGALAKLGRFLRLPRCFQFSNKKDSR